MPPAKSGAAPDMPRRWCVWLGAGLLLRLVLIYFPRTFDDDTTAYLELGQNLLHHGVYGIAADGTIYPSLFRLPGYPIFLALLGGQLRLVEMVQSLLDLVGCWMLARVALREWGERAGEAALILSSLCLFTAAYAATALTESLSVFAVCWGIYGFSLWRGGNRRGLFAMAAAAGLAMLLRPDGALLTLALLVGMGWYGWKSGELRRGMRETACVLVLACLPLGVWAARNYATFHVFQPLAPRHVNDPGERVTTGFYRWLRTWSVEFSTTGNIFWNAGQAPFDLKDVPARAFDSAEQKAETARLFGAYNLHNDISPEIDDGFARLAEERVRAHPLRYYCGMPALRVADMWMRPRTETFDLNVMWWRWRDHLWESVAAVALGLLNLGYMLLALAGMLRRRVPLAPLLLTYFVLRCILLGTLENPEPRYTLEAYPIVMLAAASVFAAKRRDLTSAAEVTA